MKKRLLFVLCLSVSSLLYSQTDIVVTSEMSWTVNDAIAKGDPGELLDASFESGDLSQYIVRNNSNVTFSISGEESCEGGKSLVISGDRLGDGTITQNVNVAKNTVYKYSFKYKSNDICGPSKVNLFIGGNTIDFLFMTTESLYCENSKWNEKVLYFNSGESTVMTFSLNYCNPENVPNGGEAGEVFIDDIKLEKIKECIGEYRIDENRRIYPGVPQEMRKRNLNEWFGTMNGGIPELYNPTIESLRQYECPEWFRDAKFGIYMHWGVYSVAEMDCWFPRHMYLPGMPENKMMKEKFGNLQEFGYKDLIPLWKAEKFNPEELVKLFKRAGAKYVTPVAVHHDNFDLWNSRYHKWNSYNMGPKMDIIGAWKEAILKEGLRFGVTTHLARSASWFNVNKLSNEDGPYDGNNPEYEDFYFKNTGEIGHTITINIDAQFRFEWACRIMDLISQHKPDLLYFDGSIPFRGVDKGRTGMEVLAYYYNNNASWHNGKNEGVMCIKNARNGYFIEGISTLDVERDHLTETSAEPWQTDDSIGPWSYVKDAEYMTVDQIIDKMVTVVSMNGNYLLNVPPRADGTLDDQTVKILEGIGEWFDVNGEAIYATRPWKQPMEGSVCFTTSKDATTLYAIALEKPQTGTLKISALSKSQQEIKSVRLIGCNVKLKWRQTEEGLFVDFPKNLPCENAWSFEIQ